VESTATKYILLVVFSLAAIRKRPLYLRAQSIYKNEGFSKLCMKVVESET
jgi:hypothetical protein